MTKQIKKRFALMLCLLLLLIPQKIYAEEEIVSDVADQKSVIEEQEINFNLGVAEYLDSIDKEDITPAKNLYRTTILTLTDEEKELILKTTYAEAGNQPIEGQRAVIEVILNRVISESFPNTVEGVLSAPRQFAVWGKLNRVVYGEKQVEAFNLVFEEEPILPSMNYVFFSRGKSNGTNHIKLEDHWFGEKRK